MKTPVVFVFMVVVLRLRVVDVVSSQDLRRELSEPVQFVFGTYPLRSNRIINIGLGGGVISCRLRIV